jgi:hypothetical protein
MTAHQQPTIATWPDITAYVAARAPVPVSVDSVMRWSLRREDPLPVKRWGTRRRPRVYAIAAELDEWLERQHRADNKERP